VGNNGPALYVGNNGTGDIASFYDIDANVEVFHIAGANGTFPNVGVKTSQPNKDFTVNGEISAYNSIWTSGNFISAGKELLSIIYPDIVLGISSYTTVKANSANWNSVYTTVNTNSANGGSVYNTVNPLSANWNSVYTSTNNTSANWNSVYVTVNPVSANWNSVYTSTNNTSANWNSVYVTVNPVSANWNSVYTTVNTNSANGGSVYNTVNPLSANWNSVYTSTNNTSGNWNSVYTEYNSNSGSYVTTTYTDSKFVQLTGGTINGSLSATGVISASASNINVNIVNVSTDVVFTNDYNNKVVHFDTTTSPLCAVFPSSLNSGFNVAIMNIGTNNLILSAANLKSAGTIITTQYGGAFVYKELNNIFAVGRLV
jgi:hypothetical protein